MEEVSLWELITTFFTIGSITIGGGPGGLSITQSYIVDKKKWLTQDEMLDFITMGQSLPGVITVNISLFVGHKLRGYKGGIVASIAVILPAFLSIIGIAVFLRPVLEMPIVQSAFSGVRVGVLGIIISAAYRMAEVMKWKIIYIILGLIALITFIITDLNPVGLFGVGALVGFLQYKKEVELRGMCKQDDID